MTSRKLKQLEEEVYQLGVRATMMSSVSAKCSNQTRHELGVYFLAPRERTDTIAKATRKAIVAQANRDGFYVKFFEKNHFEGTTDIVVRKGYSIETGIVAVFIPKYPLSQIKKITRDIQQVCAESFDYLQEDEAAVVRMSSAKEVETSVRTFTLTDKKFTIFAGDVQKSQLYVTSQRILSFYAFVGMTKEQQSDFWAISHLLGKVF